VIDIEHCAVLCSCLACYERFHAARHGTRRAGL
jgi:hypothetical protein